MAAPTAGATPDKVWDLRWGTRVAAFLRPEGFWFQFTGEGREVQQGPFPAAEVEVERDREAEAESRLCTEWRIMWTVGGTAVRIFDLEGIPLRLLPHNQERYYAEANRTIGAARRALRGRQERERQEREQVQRERDRRQVGLEPPTFVVNAQPPPRALPGLIPRPYFERQLAYLNPPLLTHPTPYARVRHVPSLEQAFRRDAEADAFTPAYLQEPSPDPDVVGVRRVAQELAAEFTGTVVPPRYGRPAPPRARPAPPPPRAKAVVVDTRERFDLLEEELGEGHIVAKPVEDIPTTDRFSMLEIDDGT